MHSQMRNQSLIGIILIFVKYLLHNRTYKNYHRKESFLHIHSKFQILFFSIQFDYWIMNELEKNVLQTID